ncbi:MAG: hypothetical protein ACLGHM_03750 [Actinomycetes bacterium]
MANPERPVSEYDRFGPWIDVVETEADVPRLYRPHGVDVTGARLVLKVPRNVARRDATPEMDLYDHLLVLEREALTVLSRTGSRYTHAVIPLGRIVAVRDAVNLLEGRLSIATDDGAELTMRFNGSARASVGLLTGALRAEFVRWGRGSVGRTLADAAPPGAVSLAALDAGGDLALGADLREVSAAHPDVRAWACHARARVAPGGTGMRGALHRVSHALSPMVVQGCVLAGDSVALEVLGRHESLVRGSTPVHSASRLTVALGAMDAVDAAAHPDYPDVTVIALRAGAWSAPLAVPRESAVAAILTRAAAASRT